MYKKFYRKKGRRMTFVRRLSLFKIDAKELWSFLFAIVLILDCRSMYGEMSITPSWWNMGLLFLLIISSVGLISTNRMSKYKLLKGLSFLIVITMYFLFYGLMKPDNLQNIIVYGSGFIIIFLTCYLIDEDDRKGVILKYRDIIYVIAVVSLFFWISGSLLKILGPSGYIYSKWSGNHNMIVVPNYWYLFFEPQTSSLAGTFAQSLPRNSAIFTEGPMASLNFSIALMVTLFIEKNINVKKRNILIIAILSTLSATGYIYILLALGIKVLSNSNRNKISKLLYLVIGVILLLLTIYFTNFIIGQKLNNGMSGNLRLDDYLASLKAWKNAPFLGVGLGNDVYIYPYMNTMRAMVNMFGLSNSLFVFLAEGGIYFMFPMIIIYTYKIRTSISSKNYNYLYVIMSVIYFSILYIFVYQYVMFFLLNYIFIENGVKEEKNNYE